jgi:multidrug resistance efflux pump
MTTYKKKKMRPHSRHLGARFIRNWPYLLWLAIIFVVIFLHATGEQLTGMTGVVEIVAEPIAPLETARLLSIDVELGQPVKAGEIVARMDTTLLDARIAVDDADIRQAEGTMMSYTLSLLQFVNRFETALTDAKAELEAAKLGQKRDTAELKELRREQKRREDLAKQGLLSLQEVHELRPQIASLMHTVAAYPELIAVHQARYDETLEVRDRIAAMLSDGTDGETDIWKAIEDAEKARREVFDQSRQRRQIQRGLYELHATRDGVVAQISSVPGDVVNSGVEIMRIVSVQSSRIIGFLPELHVSELKVGQEAFAWRQKGQGIKVPCVVVSIAPDVRALPGRVSPIRGQPLRGRRVVFKIVGEHDFIPGETVTASAKSAGLFNFGNFISRLRNSVGNKAEDKRKNTKPAK